MLIPAYSLPDARGFRGDCLSLLPRFPADHFDSCVTDPPYHLTSIVKRFGSVSAAPAKEHGGGGSYARLARGFMGKRWDGGEVAFDPQTWATVLRVLKPGAHLVAFGGTRTFHRLACAIEDAGFEIRDTLCWLYGSGFPKSHSQDGEFEGWGTALKPAWEPIILARKPISESNIASNLLAHGAGAINIDACRIPSATGCPARGGSDGFGGGWGDVERESNPLGRWPANLLLDQVSASLLDKQAGPQRSGGTPPAWRVANGKTKTVYGDFSGQENPEGIGASAGQVSRFFYCAKASTEERDAGLGELPDALAHPTLTPTSTIHQGRSTAEYEPQPRHNTHPTVKPLDLMCWLVRLVTRRGGEVLDPFAGSGSTGCAAMLEWMRFTGCDLDEDGSYLPIQERRIAYWKTRAPQGRQLALLEAVS